MTTDQGANDCDYPEACHLAADIITDRDARWMRVVRRLWRQRDEALRWWRERDGLELRELVELRAEVAGLWPRWIPVTERLPEQGEQVLTFGSGGRRVAALNGDRWWWSVVTTIGRVGCAGAPTHWMHLPDPPEAP